MATSSALPVAALLITALMMSCAFNADAKRMQLGRKLQQSDPTGSSNPATEAAVCAWFDFDDVPLNNTNRTGATCGSCRVGCALDHDCIYYSYNGSAVTTSSNATTCSGAAATGPCSWFLDDGVTPDIDLVGYDLLTCRDCQSGCFDADNCIYWSFNNSNITFYSNTNTCGIPVSDGMCQYFQADGVTPDNSTQVNVTDCESCHSQCNTLTCTYWSYNGSDVESFETTGACTADPVNPCQWYVNETTPDTMDSQGDVSSCSRCRDECRAADNCIMFSFNGSDIARFDNSSACYDDTDHTGPCRWFTFGGSPDADETQDEIRTCTECQQQCLTAPDCIYWSFNNSATERYNNTDTCGLNVTDGPCQWFRSDGVTFDNETQGNVTDCSSCQRQCRDAPRCFFWSYNGSAVRRHSTACPNGKTTACRWFLDEEETPDEQDEQVNVTDCLSCAGQCAAAPLCVYWNWNQTETLHYRTPDVCSANRTSQPNEEEDQL